MKATSQKLLISAIHFSPGQCVSAVLHSPRHSHICPPRAETIKGPGRQIQPKSLPSLRSHLCPLLLLLPCFHPGRETEDPDAGSQRGELPVTGEQDEAHDPHAGAGEGGSPEDHRTHALQPSARRPDRCGDDPDQNRTQRESQNRSQEALMASGGVGGEEEEGGGRKEGRGDTQAGR